MGVYESFGANERAIVDKIKIPWLREFVIHLIGVKLKLQWTGWLQYLILVPVVILLIITSFIFIVFGVKWLAYTLAFIGFLLSGRIIFDIIIVKYKVPLPDLHTNRKSDSTVFELMRIRHSCRSYQNKKLNAEDLTELQKSVSKHLSEPKFSMKTIRFEYISASIRVWPVVNATEFLVAIAPKQYNRLAVIDVGRTFQKIVIDATKMGLATCLIGPGADHESITNVLGSRFNPKTDNVICVCSIGYESRYKPLFIQVFSKLMRSRLPLNRLFFSDSELLHPVNLNQSPYDRLAKIFESCRWAPSSYNGQTSRGVIFTDKYKIKRIDFMASTKSRYYAAVATGIWCANWEMGCDALNIKGKFRKLCEFELEMNRNQVNVTVPIYDMSWELDY